MRLSFRWKLFFTFFTFAALVSGSVTAYFYAWLAEVPEVFTSELLLAAVSSSVHRLDAQEVASVAAAADPQSHPSFARLREILIDIHDAPPQFDSRTTATSRG